MKITSNLMLLIESTDPTIGEHVEYNVTLSSECPRDIPFARFKASKSKRANLEQILWRFVQI